MTLIYVLLLLAALASFIVAAVRYRQARQGKMLLAIGLACWVAVPLLERIQAL